MKSAEKIIDAIREEAVTAYADYEFARLYAAWADVNVTSEEARWWNNRKDTCLTALLVATRIHNRMYDSSDLAWSTSLQNIHATGQYRGEHRWHDELEVLERNLGEEFCNDEELREEQEYFEECDA